MSLRNSGAFTALSRPAQLTRRQFMSACALCVGCGASPWFRRPATAAEAGSIRPRIRLVFGETPNNQPIWPNIGYDFAARRAQMTQLLTKTCPDLDFQTALLMNDPKESQALVARDAEVDGYIVCLQGLGWSNDAYQLCTTGKPTLLVDNLFGGSGLFLGQIAKIMSSGKPVDWVSSAREQDLVDSARQFAGWARGRSAAETAAAFRRTRRDNTPAVMDWNCQEDRLQAKDMNRSFEQLKQARILVVGGGWGGDEFRKAAKETTGVDLIPVAFEELAEAYNRADSKAAGEFAERWTAQAQRIREVQPEVIVKSGAMYVAMKQLMDKRDARGISINCLGGFYGGHLKAYPCLGFSQFNNDGLVGGCEADQMSALTMMILGTLTGRPGYISDPVIDTSKNAIIYAHCVAMTRPFGTGGAPNPYEILTHSEDRQGASIRSLLPVGYMTTTLEINPVGRQVLMHQAKTIGNNPSDMACRTKLEAVVKGSLEKLTEHWSMGWHRVTFYGDLQPQVHELCDRFQFKLIEEAAA
jgi:hypothetical protein